MKTIIIAVLLSIMAFSTFAQDTSKLTISRVDTSIGSMFLMIPVINGEMKDPLARGESATYEVPRDMPVVIEYATQGQRKGVGRLVVGRITNVSDPQPGIIIEPTLDHHLIEYKPGYGKRFRQIF